MSDAIQLSKRLAKMVPDIDAVKHTVSSLDLPVEQINFEDSVIGVWFKILSLAENQEGGKLKVVNEVLNNYQKDEYLLSIKEELIAQDKSEPSSTKGTTSSTPPTINKTKLKELIAANQADEALKILNDFEDITVEQKNKIIQYQARLNKLEDDRNGGDVSEETINVEFNRLTKAVLALIDSFKGQDEEDFSRSVEEIEEEKIFRRFENIIKKIDPENFGEIRRVDCNRSKQLETYYTDLDESCSVIYILGTTVDKPSSFIERIILHSIEDSIGAGHDEQNCWIYRNPHDDFRISNIPTKLRPAFKTSKQNFSTQMESYFKGLNMDNAKDYFSGKNYSTVSIFIKFNYSSLKSILEPFTAWLHETFSNVPKTFFQICFELNGFTSVDTLDSHISEIKSNLDSVPIIPIKVMNPVSSTDIEAWILQNNLNTYTLKDFISDIEFLEVDEKDINELKKTNQLSMLAMETFQEKLYSAYQIKHKYDEK